MIEKNFKLSFVFMVSALLLFYSATVFASQSTPTTKRLSGADRYATSAAVALSGWTQSNYAILASGENFSDAISAAPLAKKYDSPILLTKTDSIPAETLNVIKQLKVKNIIIIGGTGSISAAVEKQLASSGMAVTRIFGQDRYETCINIAEQLDNVTEIAVVTGESFPDALSISPIAVKRNMPIILVSHNKIPRVVKDYINSHKLTTTYVIGSGTSLNNAVLKGLSNIELVTGTDKYQINLNIIDRFKGDLNLGTVYVASGEGFADALSGSILAGKNSNPLLLIGNDPSIEKNYFANNYNTISNINVLGGIGVVSDEVINKFIGTSITTTSSAMNKIEFISTHLTKTGPNTATFQYRVLNKNGTDITKTVPASDIGAVASVSSSITLDPLTGTGTITFKYSSDADKQAIVTLIDKVAGKTVTLNAKYSESQPINNFLPVAKIDFPSANLTKIGTSTATFSYKILDKNGIDITKTVPASDLHAISWIGSSSSPVSLNPQTGTGTITYNFSDTDKNITVQLAYNNGIVGTSTLSFDASTTVSDTKVARITFTTFTLTKTGPNTATFQYKVLNKNGEDITKIVPASQLKAVASVGSSITLNPLTGIGTIALNTSCASDKPIIVTISDDAAGIADRIQYPSLNPVIGVRESKKIGKIIITSSGLMIYSPESDHYETDEISGIGFAAFEVLDENGKNITSTHPQLANNIEFKCDVAKVSAHTGFIRVALNKDVDLTTVKSVVITATDPITGVSTSATLSIYPQYVNK